MSQLPNANAALVDVIKVRDYLLNPDNVQNGGKARLFASFGFNRAGWPVLMQALRCHPIDNLVIHSSTSVYGTKHVVQCHLTSPDGRNPCLTTIWIIDAGQSLPRLVTAF